jgi:hypothetical protein
MADGISRLIHVTQQKAANANEEAMSAAEKQKSLIDQQKSLRGTQSTFESLTKDSGMTATEGKTIAGAIGSEATVAKPAHYLGRFAKSGFEGSSRFAPSELVKNLEVVSSSATRFASGIGAFIDAFKKALEESTEDLESQDRMSNFEIQNLMSRYNESASLATSTKKKTDDQNGSVMRKIG